MSGTLQSCEHPCWGFVQTAFEKRDVCDSQNSLCEIEVAFLAQARGVGKCRGYILGRRVHLRRGCATGRDQGHGMPPMSNADGDAFERGEIAGAAQVRENHERVRRGFGVVYMLKGSLQPLSPCQGVRMQGQ